MTISLKDMIAELRRELRYRQIIYPSLIRLTGRARGCRRYWTCWSGSRKSTLVQRICSPSTPERRSCDAGICTASIPIMHSDD